MTATEAIIYCLGYVGEDEDGELRSRPVYDSTGDPHWISWNAKHGHLAEPPARRANHVASGRTPCTPRPSRSCGPTSTYKCGGDGS